MKFKGIKQKICKIVEHNMGAVNCMFLQHCAHDICYGIQTHLNYLATETEQ